MLENIVVLEYFEQGIFFCNQKNFLWKVLQAFVALACANNGEDRIFLYKSKALTATYACNNTYTFFSVAEKITFVIKDNLYIERGQVITIQYGTDKLVAEFSCFGQFDCFVLHDPALGGGDLCKELESATNLIQSYKDFHLSFHQKDNGFRMLVWREQDGSQIVQDCIKI